MPTLAIDRQWGENEDRMSKDPSLTYMALTARAADYAVKAMDNEELRCCTTG